MRLKLFKFLLDRRWINCDLQGLLSHVFTGFNARQLVPDLS